MHSKILANIYFISGYATSLAMFTSPEVYLKCLGVFIASYLTYLLSEQLTTKE